MNDIPKEINTLNPLQALQGIGYDGDIPKCLVCVESTTDDRMLENNVINKIIPQWLQ